jgi:hypothetical protein
MGLLVEQYIVLGGIPVSKNPKTGAINPLPFPAGIRRSLVGHLDNIPLITQQLEVDPSGAYEGVPHLVDIASNITFAGGVNAPKVVRVTDSSGRQQRQLVKSGSDDLRQVGGRRERCRRTGPSGRVYRKGGEGSVQSTHHRLDVVLHKMSSTYDRILDSTTALHVLSTKDLLLPSQDAVMQQFFYLVTIPAAMQVPVEYTLVHIVPMPLLFLLQDAVMQQFFSLVTSLLAADPATARRRLGMSGYKVVPCSPSAGVVEWVDHTLPCIDYLAGEEGVGRGGWEGGFKCGNSVLWTVIKESGAPSDPGI